jgi:hypothetical protein
MPLVRSGAAKSALNRTAAELFPSAPEPVAAMAGLHLYLGNWDDAHAAADSGERASHYFWHAIVHRQEPDPGNSAYWFRMTGQHPVFAPLREQAARLGYDTGKSWDPVRFIKYCAAARPGSEEEKLAMRVQLAEWRLLFDHCARGGARRRHFWFWWS